MTESSAYPLRNFLSSSSSNVQWRYDVFLSFRGEDTRNNFTSHLYTALNQKGLLTFRDDDQLRRGEEISPALLEAIERSWISVIVFSQNYADSRWCLDELVKIVECKELRGQMVCPIFYDVDPHTVRKQTGSYGEALERHKRRRLKCGATGRDKVELWKLALEKTANLSGWHLCNENESTFIQKIVEEISLKLSLTSSYAASDVIGIDSMVQHLRSSLNNGSDGVHMVGIFGIGGVGKTTIANSVYNLIANQFEGSCFLANVSEISKQHSLAHLQETLLFQILRDKNLKKFTIDRGISVIKHRLRHKRILLVLDDVDQEDQLKVLAGERDWFGPGSRIVITTRDKHLLVSHGVEKRYEVVGLYDNNALELFCWNAFGKAYPTEGFEELSNKFVKYTKGLPLALKVLGSFLCRRNISEWKSQLKKLERTPHKKIYEVLKVSFDGLDEYEQAIFLDIACFFKGANKDFVLDVLNGGDELYTEIGIRALVDKCLLSIELNKLYMHDLLQEMGREIVRQECPDNPGKRSRLWFHEDVLQVLEENMGTKKIEGIMLDFPKEKSLVEVSPDAFTRMKNLRLLISRGVHLSGLPESLSKKLTHLDWLGYPSSSLPSDFGPKKLVNINMRFSRIKHLEDILKNTKNLKHIDFGCCQFLTEIPNLSSLKYLESIVLDHCGNLVKVDESVGFLDKLIILDLGFCYKLWSLPRSLKLKSLRTLILSHCSILEEFPNISEEMECLEEIPLEGTAIKELPSSIERVTGLKVLKLLSCKSLTKLPSSIYKLQRLEELYINGCSRLGKFPENVRDGRQQTLSSLLQTGDTHSSASVERCSLSGFLNLRVLDLQACNLSSLEFLSALNSFSTLKALYLSRNNFVSLPTCISQLISLEHLELRNCIYLQEIPEFPPNLECIIASGCTSLERISQLSGIWRLNRKVLKSLRYIDFSKCPKLVTKYPTSFTWIEFFKCVDAPVVQNDNLRRTSQSKVVRGDSEIDIILPGDSIPMWFQHAAVSNSLSFSVHCSMYEKIIGLALGAVFRINGTSQMNVPCEVQVAINDQMVFSFMKELQSLESGHMWLHYLPRKYMITGSDELMCANYSFFKVSFIVVGEPTTCTLTECGAYIIYDEGITPQISEKHAKSRRRQQFNPRSQEPSILNRIYGLLLKTVRLVWLLIKKDLRIVVPYLFIIFWISIICREE